MCVCLHVQRGKGGQVFTLTQFNKGCAFVCLRVCVSNCLFAFVRLCFRGEYTSKDMEPWTDG